MATSQNPSPAPNWNEDLGEKCAALQQQINILLFALLVVSCTISAYFYMQDRWASREQAALKVPLQLFELQEKPKIETFISKLLDYGKSHPDFAPIIEKYKISATAPAAPTPPAN
jgi:hypothetical protein